jgi:hypothetical protein
MVEAGIAETAKPGAVFYGTNYSACFGDPFGQTWLRTEEIKTQGAASFLARADAYPSWDNDERRAAVVHVVTAAAEYTDKGKVALTVPDAVASEVAQTLAAATKTLRVEHKRAERDAAAAARSRERDRRRAAREAEPAPEPKVTLRDAVFDVMADAVDAASAGGTLPFGTRALYYQVRPRIQAMTDAELRMAYFSQTLVVDYEREHGKIPGHYRESRGELFEPHTGRSVRLGTREVADYRLPDHVFNKMLYVEKEGLIPVFEASRIADRYDMAIAFGKGQPVEAIRELFARAHTGPGNYKLFVLHDADHAGYVIGRAMADETERMPGYHVAVIDLGLSVADAIARRLPTEAYTRKVELPWWMPDQLDTLEREWFDRPRRGKYWECTRVELNALGPAVIDLVVEGLEAHRATGKVIPPSAYIRARAHGQVRAQVHQIVDAVLAELIDPEGISEQVTGEFATSKMIGIPQSTLNRRLRGNSLDSWQVAVDRDVTTRINLDRIRARVRELMTERIEGAS